MLDNRLVREAKAYRPQFLKIAACALAGALGTVCGAWTFAVILQRVFLEAIPLRSAAPLLAALFLIACMNAYLRQLARQAAYDLTLSVQTKLRARLLRSIFALGPVSLAAEKSGRLMACLTEGVDALEKYFTDFLPQCVAAAVIPPVIFFAALPADWQTALLFLLTAPLIPVFMFLIGKRAKQAGRRQWKTLSALSARFLDLLEGMTTLKFFNRSQAQLSVVAAMSEQFRGATMQVLRVAFLSAFVLELVATLSVAIVAVTVGLRLLNGQIPFLTAFFVLLLAPEFYKPPRALGSAFHSAVAGAAAAEKVYAYLHCSRRPRPTKNISADGGDIRFENVHYRYSENRETVLNGVSFTVPAASHTAIVGISGAGKSTLLQLLLGFTVPSRGKILVGETDAAEIAPQSLRSQIAYLPQSPHIFHMTAAENIALAKPDAAPEEIAAAAEKAQIADWLESLPRGYQTMLGEGGQPLSGGQAQRIAIARALLQDAPILLLDEPAAALDAENEQKIRLALRCAQAGRTRLTITHRLRAAAAADQIILLDQGRVAEAGSHEKLLAADGLYAALYRKGTN